MSQKVSLLKVSGKNFLKISSFLEKYLIILPNLNCREIADCSHYIGKSFCCHKSSESEQLLLKLRHNLLVIAISAAPAFHSTQDRQGTTVQQTRSTIEHNTTTERPPAITVRQTFFTTESSPPAVHLTTTNRTTIPLLPGRTAERLGLRHQPPRASTNVTLTL